MSLALVPDGIQLLERVLLNGVSNANTRRAYSRALDKFLEWYKSKGTGECRDL